MAGQIQDSWRRQENQIRRSRSHGVAAELRKGFHPARRLAQAVQQSLPNRVALIRVLVRGSSERRFCRFTATRCSLSRRASKLQSALAHFTAASADSRKTSL